MHHDCIADKVPVSNGHSCYQFVLPILWQDLYELAAYRAPATDQCLSCCNFRFPSRPTSFKVGCPDAQHVAVDHLKLVATAREGTSECGTGSFLMAEFSGQHSGPLNGMESTSAVGSTPQSLPANIELTQQGIPVSTFCIPVQGNLNIIWVQGSKELSVHNSLPQRSMSICATATTI